MKARDKRIRPGLDDKILTSWNGLMISALCDAYLSFGDLSFFKRSRRRNGSFYWLNNGMIMEH